MKILRFIDLKELGIVSNRPTLKRWIAGQGFPKPLQLGSNTVGWREDEVQEWLAAKVAERDTAA